MGLRGFHVFIACIALGVAAIAGVGSLSGSLADGLAREGRTILGADVAFSLIHREAGPAERTYLHARGAVSVVATLRAMARLEEGMALVEVKAVDAAYPLYGTVALDRNTALRRLVRAARRRLRRSRRPGAGDAVRSQAGRPSRRERPPSRSAPR